MHPIRTFVIISIVWLFSGCATVQHMPLSKMDSSGNTPDDNLIIYFYDEAPEKSRIVREVVVPISRSKHTNSRNN